MRYNRIELICTKNIKNVVSIFVNSENIRMKPFHFSSKGCVDIGCQSKLQFGTVRCVCIGSRRQFRCRKEAASRDRKWFGRAVGAADDDDAVVRRGGVSRDFPTGNGSGFGGGGGVAVWAVRRVGGAGASRCGGRRLSSGTGCSSQLRDAGAGGDTWRRLRRTRAPSQLRAVSAPTGHRGPAAGDVTSSTHLT